MRYLFFTLLFVVFLSVRYPVYADWELHNGSWKYLDEAANTYKVHQVAQIDNEYYLFDDTGAVMSGYWRNRDTGKLYYFREDHTGSYGQLIKETGVYNGYLFHVNDDYSLNVPNNFPTYNEFVGEINPDNDKRRVKIACIGDSITFGLYVSNPQNTYPNTLQTLIGDKGEVRNFGLSNASASSFAELSYSSSEECLNSKAYHADIYLIMLGTNDIKSMNWMSAEAFEDEYEGLVRQYLSYGEVILLQPVSIYNENVTDGESDPSKLPIIRQKIASIGSKYSLQVIDTYTVTNNAPELYNADGIHLNDTGAIKVAEYIYNSIERVHI